MNSYLLRDAQSAAVWQKCLTIATREEWCEGSFAKTAIGGLEDSEMILRS